MKSILVMQLFRHNAVLQSTPALSALRNRFPGARIQALVCKPFGDALRENPDVDEVIEWDIDSLDAESADAEVTVERLSELKDSLRPIREGRNFDAVYNLSNNALSALVAYLLKPRDAAGLVFCRDRRYRVRNDWLRYLFAPQAASLDLFNRADVYVHACGGSSAARLPLRVTVTTADERYADEVFGRHFRDRAAQPIGIQANIEKDCKARLAVYFEEVAAHLWQSGHAVLLLGEEKNSFGRLAALLQRCRLLVSGDTAAVHVAAAAGTPCLVLLPRSPDAASGWETGPYGEGHFVLEPRAPRSDFSSGDLLTSEVVVAAVDCALSDGREVPESLRNPACGMVLHRSRWMPDGLLGLVPLARPALTLKDLLRLVLRGCLRHQRLAEAEVGRSWRPWADEVFSWYSLDAPEPLLGQASQAVENFTMLRRVARLGVDAANVAVMQTSARATRFMRVEPGLEQQILALEENGTLAPLIAGFRQSLLDIAPLPPRQKAVAQRWNYHTLAEESAFMAQALRDFAGRCEDQPCEGSHQPSQGFSCVQDREIL